MKVISAIVRPLLMGKIVVTLKDHAHTDAGLFRCFQLKKSCYLKILTPWRILKR